MSNIVKQITATIALLKSNHRDEVGIETMLLCLSKARKEIVDLRQQLDQCAKSKGRDNVIRLDV